MKKTYLVAISICIALFILSAAIACPILIRGIYYGQIDSLGLVERTGYSEDTIKEAFDEMMDYCVKGGPNGNIEFGTGDLAWSESGKAHFDDVSRLFILDLNLLKVTGIVFILYIAFTFFAQGGKDEGEEPDESDRGDIISLGRGPFFWGPAGLLGIIAVVVIAGAINFDRVFVTFHHVFFPGKENWIFDERYDEIIKILPEEVFRNFAILIAVLVLILSVASIAFDLILHRRKERNA